MTNRCRENQIDRAEIVIGEKSKQTAVNIKTVLFTKKWNVPDDDKVRNIERK